MIALACVALGEGSAGADSASGNTRAFVCPVARGIDKPPSRGLAASVLNRLNDAWDYTTTTLTDYEVLISPARSSPLAGVAKGCGSLVNQRSVWVHVCPPGAPEPCSTKVAPGLSSDVLLVRRNGQWLAWFWLPYGGKNPVPPT